MTSDPNHAAPDALSHVASTFDSIRVVPAGAPFLWLAKGFADLRAMPACSLFYGVAFALMGWAMAFIFSRLYSFTLALMGGFMLLGPGLAMGLYSLSHQRERGEPADLRRSFTVWRVNLSNLAIYALVTGVVFLIWARASLIVFALFYDSGLPTVGSFLDGLLSFDNLEFVIVYMVVGGFFAGFVFAISVVAVPLMLDRRNDAVTAMLLSIATVIRNPLPMLVWAALIVILTVLGFATVFVGLVPAVPILGHATWHAYRALLPPGEAAGATEG